VLFVCHGNIIRSPMAEVVFRKRCGIPSRSAGLHAIQGNAADKRAVEIAPEFGVSLREHQAALVTHELLAPYDLVVAMDRFNEARLLHRYPEAAAKIVMLGTFAPQHLPGDEIPDPYLLDECAIRDCYRTIDACVGQLADYLEAFA
jgi:protein-tyrosine phosphatase